jgi:predicted DNA-binding transcriptional regulator AlpA
MELLGASEAAEVLGVSRQRVYQLVETYSDFPKPVAQLGRGAIWKRSDIERWAKGWERKSGRPHKPS